MTAKSTIAKSSLRIFCAMLLLFAGLAHQPAAAQGLPSAGLATYVLPDGTIAALCQPGDDGKPVKAAWRGCEVCRIAAGALLPPPPANGQAIERFLIPLAFPSITIVVDLHSFEPGARPRGPPEFSA